LALPTTEPHSPPHLFQANLGAQNHAVVLEDANPKAAVAALVAAGFGASGQRCMAISRVVLVGQAKALVPMLVAEGKKLTMGKGSTPGVDVPPLNSAAAKERITVLLDRAVKAGASLPLDGRGATVAGLPHGNWVGPTLVTGVDTYMEIYKNEVFGPVLQVRLGQKKTKKARWRPWEEGGGRGFGPVQRVGLGGQRLMPVPHTTSHPSPPPPTVFPPWCSMSPPSTTRPVSPPRYCFRPVSPPRLPRLDCSRWALSTMLSVVFPSHPPIIHFSPGAHSGPLCNPWYLPSVTYWRWAL
jgi:hypothetical protein